LNEINGDGDGDGDELCATLIRSTSHAMHVGREC